MSKKKFKMRLKEEPVKSEPKEAKPYQTTSYDEAVMLKEKGLKIKDVLGPVKGIRDKTYVFYATEEEIKEVINA